MTEIFFIFAIKGYDIHTQSHSFFSMDLSRKGMGIIKTVNDVITGIVITSSKQKQMRNKYLHVLSFYPKRHIKFIPNLFQPLYRTKYIYKKDDKESFTLFSSDLISP